MSHFVWLGKEVENWWNPIKIRLMRRYIKTAKTTYTLFLDSNDTAIIDIDSIVEKFKTFNCDMLYNAQTTAYPTIACSDSETASGDDYPYLNSGAWIGVTNKVDPFLKAALESTPDPTISFIEQS